MEQNVLAPIKTDEGVVKDKQNIKENAAHELSDKKFAPRKQVKSERDVFSPRIYKDFKASGRRESFLCYQNPAFDNSYDTFQNGEENIEMSHPTSPSRGTQGSIQTGSVDPNNEINVSVAEPNRVNVGPAIPHEDYEDGVEDITADILAESLPSTQMRKLRGLARPGSVRQRIQTRDGLRNVLEQDVNNGSRSGTSWEPMYAEAFVSDGMVDADINNEMNVEGLELQDSAHFKQTSMPLRAKKSIRRTVSRRPKPKKVSRWKQFKYNMSIKWGRFKDSFKDFFGSFDLWGSHLKQVQGVFGTGVLSYFTFLRWLFFLNTVISLLTLAFLFVPQITHDPSPKHNNLSFTGKELLTGEGWFTRTELYYGSYTNSSIPVPGSTPYLLPHAYLFVGGGYLLLCIIILVQSMAKSYRNNYIIGGEHFNSFISKVFTSWDYAITDNEAAKIKSKSIFNDLIESLREGRKKVKLSSYETCCLLFTRLCTNITVLALMAGSAYLIFVVSDGSVKTNAGLFDEVLPAFTISGLNLILPFAFRIIASMENYRSPRTEITISLIRTIVLKLSSLCVYVVCLHTEIKCIVGGNERCKKISCWESWVGSAFYKLVIMDFFFILVSAFFGEFVRRIISVYIDSCRDKLGVPGFDISRNVLDLIYAQGVIWLGTFYCPLLPLINLIKLLIIFYVKKYSLMRNCRPSMRPFKASKMNLLFLTLLGFMLLLALIVMGYVIISSGSVYSVRFTDMYLFADLKPSNECGPFRGKNSIYDLVDDIRNDLGLTLKQIVQIISSASLLTAFVFVLGLLAYYFKLRKSSAEKKIKLLKEQIALIYEFEKCSKLGYVANCGGRLNGNLIRSHAGQDKLFLIHKLREMIKETTPETLPGALPHH